MDVNLEEIHNYWVVIIVKSNLIQTILNGKYSKCFVAQKVFLKCIEKKACWKKDIPKVQHFIH